MLLMNYFVVLKFKIKYEEDSDSGSFWDYYSDSDSDIEGILNGCEDSESDSDSDY